ncbi:MAG TPA: hypothetical protein VKH64_13450 [Candidatus Binatia bacterium]|nr:hypothetical protein [Candidatus Binatia bacterium]
MHIRRSLLLLPLFFLAYAPPARAQLDPWEFEVYGYQTVPRGMLEIESLNSVVLNGSRHGEKGTSKGTVPSQSMWRTSIEMTYGLTDRIEAAMYVNLAKPRGDDIQYAGSKWRLRGRLFDQGELPVDVGWYFELAYKRTPKYDDQKLELELRPILQRDLGDFSFIVSPKFEKILVGSEEKEGWEFGYVSGIYYRWMRAFSPGVEFYGAIGMMKHPDPTRDQQHYIFPVVRGEYRGIEYSLGPGFGLTHGSDRTLVKFNLGLEKYIGAIFGPSTNPLF